MTESPSRVVFRDPRQKLATRVSDLLARLSPAEKIALLHQHQAPVPALGLAGFRTGTEALHGVAWLGTATVFPQVVGLASSWDPDLLRRVGEAVGAEVRAMHHANPEQVGLNVWAPVVNLLRDPRWGRNEEGYSEDPWLTGVLSTAYATGLRGDHPQWLRTAPTLKHFLAYNNETDRCLTSSNLPPRVLHEYELPAFRPAIESGAAVAVMASYNLINGRPTHVSPLINEVLRGWSVEDVMVVGDAYAVHNIAGDQHWEDDHVAGFAAALRAGVDCVTEEGDDPAPTIARFTSALERGLITESDVDAAVRHILSVRIRLGEFNPAEDPYRTAPPEVIDRAAHRELAREAARASIVLLSNDGILPLNRSAAERVAVIGPLADAVFEDWYSGTPPYRRTLRSALDDAVFHEGVDRVSLRGAGGRLAVVDGILQIRSLSGTPDNALFDILDWGQETISLRAVTNGLFVGFDGTLLRNDQPGPNGWEVKETFELVPSGDGTALRHPQSGFFLRAGADGLVRPDAPDLTDATVFAVDVLVDGVAAAAAVAADADVVVLALGNHPMVCGRETIDRRDLDLPGTQDELMRAVRAVNPRTVLALTSSYPYAIGWAKEHLPAVLWSAHGGQEHGTALADVLFGAEPSGRLTQTWYTDDSELPDLLDYDIIATDATYQYYRGTPLFPFGHGLGYTRFQYDDLRLTLSSSAETSSSSDRLAPSSNGGTPSPSGRIASTSNGETPSPGGETPSSSGRTAPSSSGQVRTDSVLAVGPSGTVTVSVDVTNVGDRPGDEVVQLYTRQQRSRVKQPLRRLRGHQRVRLAPGERARVTFVLDVAELAFWDVTRSRWVVEQSTHTIAVGSSSLDWALTATLRVRGEVIPSRAARSGLRMIDNDGYAGTTPVAITADPGEALRSVTPDAWTVFADVDLNGGLQHLSMLASSSLPSSASSSVASLEVATSADTSAFPGDAGTSISSGDAGRSISSGDAGKSTSSGDADISGASGDVGTVVVRLDDPFIGPVLATLTVPPATGRLDVASVQAMIGPVSGLHDVFVCFDRPGIVVANLAFS
ncbi:glycoside hydrolase family 3 protein [Actinoplanes regularis]|uniref:glycoside hydrolase family 3 protein n=1 Tax=Actinoplanes regularis TaxID=52697 RepID=UPI0024A3321E|nr:glycoside hydrolase family 3 protein [Actinoplanes regularis]GLW30784.1 sugar hydrolase [Actinoplanes regularis]